MAEQRTRPTAQPVAEHLAGLADERQRADSERLCALMERVTGEPPVMWGPGIVGFGSYHYRYASGHEGDAAVLSFAPRARNLTLYLSCDVSSFSDQLGRLGPHRTGKGCLYLARLSDVDEQVLEELLREAAAAVQQR